MAGTIAIVGITALIAAVVGAMIALKLQYTYLNRMQAQQKAWERAQESHRRGWEESQMQHSKQVEEQLVTYVQQIQAAWEAWKEHDKERVEAFVKQFQASAKKVELERELARLPRVEDAPLVLNTKNQYQHSIPNWKPPILQSADLSAGDLSHLFLAQADLRWANLRKTNFYMADLSGANLTGANLAEADLAGANLTGADLRGAVLTQANFLVADLQDTILIDADLQGARNLTIEQIYSAVFDETTQLDAALNVTVPRLPRIQLPPKSATVESGTEEQEAVSSDAPALRTLPETPIPTLLPDVDALMQSQEETPLSSPQSSNGSLLDPEVIDLLVDRPENTHTEEFGTTIPRVGYNGTQQVTAS